MIKECEPAQHDFGIITVAEDIDMPRKTRTLRCCKRCGKASELVRGPSNVFSWISVAEEEATHSHEIR